MHASVVDSRRLFARRAGSPQVVQVRRGAGIVSPVVAQSVEASVYRLADHLSSGSHPHSRSDALDLSHKDLPSALFYPGNFSLVYVTPLLQQQARFGLNNNNILIRLWAYRLCDENAEYLPHHPLTSVPTNYHPGSLATETLT